jgi:hypothetical protein
MRVRNQLREDSSVSDMYSLEVARLLMTRHSVVATPVDTAVQAPVHVAEEASDSGRQQCLCGVLYRNRTGDPSLPSMRRWFATPRSTSRAHTIAQVRAAVERLAVGAA